jgi:NRPS condensation-like uncharacterized protein
MRTLFEASTVALLATEVERLRQRVGGLTRAPVTRVPRDGALPLSFAQERLWFFDQLEPNSAAYNIHRALRLRGPLDRNALQQSFDELVKRHEVLRTSFKNHNGKPTLSIEESGKLEVQYIDLRHLPNAKREEESRARATQEANRPFELKRHPLVRAVLIEFDTEDHLLLLTIHHIISDGWSIGILLSELESHYNATVQGKKCSLPDLPMQYVDFAGWERESLTEDRLKSQVDYWVAQLSNAPATINLPSDRAHPSVRSFRGAKHALTITKDIADKLTEIGRKKRATLFMTMLAAFQALLACITGDEDLVVGSPIVVRRDAETENLIGNFTNTIALRAKFSGDPDFNEMLRQARDAALGAFTNQDVPFEKLVDKLQPVRTLSHNPLFQVWFVLQNPHSKHRGLVGLTSESLIVESGDIRHDLQLTLWETSNGLKGTLNYSTALFEPESIAQIEKQFQSLLVMITDHPDTRLSTMRSALTTVAHDYREKLSQQVEESNRRNLKLVRRKAVYRVQPPSGEEPWTTPTQ